jgi:hypothetical protein
VIGKGKGDWEHERKRQVEGKEEAKGTGKAENKKGKIALYSVQCSGGRRQIDCLCGKRVVQGCRGEGGRGMGGKGYGRGGSVAKWKIPGKHQPSLFRTAGNFSDFTLP